MEYLSEWLDYFWKNPGALVGVGVLVVAVFWFLNRKPPVVREAEGHLKALLKEGDDQYKSGRSLR